MLSMEYPYHGLRPLIAGEGSLWLYCFHRCLSWYAMTYSAGASPTHGDRHNRHLILGQLVIPIDVSNCPWCVLDVLSVKGNSYGLAGVTYGCGSHFVSTIRCIPLNKSALYDGLRDYHSNGTALKKRYWRTPHPKDIMYYIIMLSMLRYIELLWRLSFIERFIAANICHCKLWRYCYYNLTIYFQIGSNIFYSSQDMIKGLGRAQSYV